MTIGELIELLLQHPGDAEVRIQHDTPFPVSPSDVEVFEGMEDNGWEPKHIVRYVLIV